MGVGPCPGLHAGRGSPLNASAFLRMALSGELPEHQTGCPPAPMPCQAPPEPTSESNLPSNRVQEEPLLGVTILQMWEGPQPITSVGSRPQ